MAGARQRLDAVEVLLFDLDDTLVDTRDAWRAGFGEAVEPLLEGLPALAAAGSLDELHDRCRGYSAEEQRRAGDAEWSHEWNRRAFHRLLGEHGGTAAQADAAWHSYREAWPRHLRPFEDALPTLERLAGRCRLGLISNGLAADQRPKLDRFDLARFFPVVVISEEAGLRKPDPAIFARALDGLGAAGQPAAYVGDNPAHDVAGAHAAGIAAIWLRRPGAWHDDAGDAVPDVELSSLAELPPLLGGGNEGAREGSAGPSAG
ncbi:MAG: HAD family hydrolase [Chloroflexi bacterium]|nr:HAD family hydrolase [Chloroflexota bacterium]